MIPEAIEEKGQVYVHVNKLLEEREKTTRSMLELERYKNNIDELENFILNHYIVGHKVQNASLDDILNKLKELKERNKIDE